MRIALIVFMVLSGLVCIFSIVVMVRDIIIERKSKQEQEEAPAPAPVPAIAAPTVVAAPRAFERVSRAGSTGRG